MPATPLYLCGCVDSVLDTAHELTAQSCLPVWGGVLAGSQRRGRGQMRRTWSSPPGNIYAALRLPPAGPFASGAAALFAGALLVEAFAQRGIRLLLKWPNDLLLCAPSGGGASREDPRGKMGGILLEERAGALIAGIGLNVASAPSLGLIREGGLPAVCLNDVPQVAIQGQDALLEFWACLVESFIFCYHQWKKLDKSAWLASAEQRLAWKGAPVLLDDGEPCPGVLLGLAASGGVRLACDGAEKEFVSGSLFPAPLSSNCEGCPSL
ncbi:MAG: biotin--[acetyl-CoA-carboxylase] ligase [Deltaproteobacteria bacterium]|nr:biotin--[acetyl-CoA-carboxylase] ligase [Deltaproteobacteria bacterium]